MDFLTQNLNFILTLSGYVKERTDTGAHWHAVHEVPYYLKFGG
jgi:hypothetical protein